MAKQFRTLAIVVVPILTLALGWQLGLRMQAQAMRDFEQSLGMQFRGGSGSTLQDPEKDVDPTLLWSTWRLLLKNYVDPSKLQKEDMLYGAAKGLAGSMGDPYTLFMTPKENEDFKQTLSGNLEGIGAELADRDGSIVVVTPLRGSPAERAGLKAGDIILTIDGSPTDGLTLPDVVGKIRGAQGTTVVLGVASPGTPAIRTLTIARENIHIPSAEWHVEESPDGAIGYMAINQFGDDTLPEVKQGLAELKKAPLKGLIIDLRNNGGGYLDGAVDLVSLFLQKGKVVTVARREGAPQEHYVSGRPELPNLPMAVIINAGSASASEIAAGALQDNKRATIIGVKSFGKGTVQEVIDLPGGSSLRVTIAHWLLPSGRDLGKDGVHPDILVEQPQTGSGDVQLQTTLTFLRTGQKPAAAAPSPSSSSNTAQ